MRCSIGAAAALVLVALSGALIRAPLQRVPENTLKFVVGVMLTSFGMFWGGEGVGIIWPGSDLFLLALIAFYLLVSFALILWLRPYGSSGKPRASASYMPGTPAVEEAR